MDNRIGMMSELLRRALGGIVLRRGIVPPEVHLHPEAQLQASQWRSIFCRHLDTGSCNGCELELNALLNPVYDMEKYGIHIEASPRSANLLLMTGAFTRNLEEAALLTLEAMPVPRIVAVGECAINGGLFANSYAVKRHPQIIENALICRIPGCPPEPEQILNALLMIESGPEGDKRRAGGW